MLCNVVLVICWSDISPDKNKELNTWLDRCLTDWVTREIEAARMR